MPCLDRAKILAADDRKRVRLEVPEWGGHLWIGTMSGSDRDDWENASADRADNESKLCRLEKRAYDWKRVAAMTRARVVAWCAENDEGAPLFGRDEEAVIALAAKAGPVLDRLYAVAASLNALTRQDVEDILGKFGGVPSDAASSASP